MRRISLALIIGLAVPALAAGAAEDTKLTLVAYSTPKDAYGQLIPAFQKTQAGNGVSFSQSYGASGEQSRAAQTRLVDRWRIHARIQSPDRFEPRFAEKRGADNQANSLI